MKVQSNYYFSDSICLKKPLKQNKTETGTNFSLFVFQKAKHLNFGMLELIQGYIYWKAREAVL